MMARQPKELFLNCNKDNVYSVNNQKSDYCPDASYIGRIDDSCTSKEDFFKKSDKKGKQLIIVMLMTMP